eukprot:m.193418 g.193418  ORF g.193418 m.193418 type:complete len:275 (-) comp18635_c1_seq2:2644-3468(-)
MSRISTIFRFVEARQVVSRPVISILRRCAATTILLRYDEPTYGIAKTSLTEIPKTRAGAISLYDEWSDTYDKTLESWNYDAPTKCAAQLCKLLTSQDGIQGDDWSQIRVLDAGCGTGLVGAALYKEGVRSITGVDVSVQSLEVCRTARAGVYDILRQADLDFGCTEAGDEATIHSTGNNTVSPSTMPSLQGMFQEDGFDAAVCVGVLSYIHASHALFSELARTVRPGGVVMFTHRMWDDVDDGCRAAAEALEQSSTWRWCAGSTSERLAIPLSL